MSKRNKWKLMVLLAISVFGLTGIFIAKEYLSRHFPEIVRKQPAWFSLTVIRAMGWQEARWYPGLTPLMLAAKSGQVQVVKSLIKLKE